MSKWEEEKMRKGEDEKMRSELVTRNTLEECKIDGLS